MILLPSALTRAADAALVRCDSGIVLGNEAVPLLKQRIVLVPELFISLQPFGHASRRRWRSRECLSRRLNVSAVANLGQGRLRVDRPSRLRTRFLSSGFREVKVSVCQSPQIVASLAVSIFCTRLKLIGLR